VPESLVWSNCVRATDQTLAERIAWRVVALNAAIEAATVVRTCSEDCAGCLFQFEVDADTIERVGYVLSSVADLWQDFQRAMDDHRPSSHWQSLMEHALAVGQLQAKLSLLEVRFLGSSADDRRRLADQVNCVDGEIGWCRHLADRRHLATRINEHAGFPLIDGLTLHGVMFIFGEHADQWRAFQVLIEEARVTTREGS
jgi:hypothetical protein